jgi:hypothetical protein
MTNEEIMNLVERAQDYLRKHPLPLTDIDEVVDESEPESYTTDK